MANTITLGPTGTRYGASMSIEWTGLETIRANLKAIVERYPIEVGLVLREECLAIMEDSLRICPFDQNNIHEDGSLHLNETADVAGPYFDEGIYCILSYDTPYAVLQHEVQEYHHDAPEQWKYLEHPMNARAKVIASNIVRGVDLERLLIGYSAQSWVDINAELGLAQRKAQMRYGHLLGRFV